MVENGDGFLFCKWTRGVTTATMISLACACFPLKKRINLKQLEEIP